VQYHITSAADTPRDSVDGNRSSSASVRIYSLKPSRNGASLFPKLDECAHFHYEFVELQKIEVCLVHDCYSTALRLCSFSRVTPDQSRSQGKPLRIDGVGFVQTRCPSCSPTNSVKTLKEMMG